MSLTLSWMEIVISLIQVVAAYLIWVAMVNEFFLSFVLKTPQRLPTVFEIRWKGF